MKLGGIITSESLSYAGRLLKDDIVRIPSPQKNKADFYIRNIDNKPEHGKHFWRNIFTALTFGMTGLYLAHRNNLFNPARKEAKRIVKAEETINKIKTYVQESLTNDTYKAATQRTLALLAKDGSRGSDFSEEARRILRDDSALDGLYNILFIKPKNKLIDDKDIARYQDGYVVDILDKLSVKIEKMLSGMKQNGENIKGQKANILQKIFDKDEHNATIVGDTLLEIIGNRSAGTIENYVQDSLIASKFGN